LSGADGARGHRISDERGLRIGRPRRARAERRARVDEGLKTEASDRHSADRRRTYRCTAGILDRRSTAGLGCNPDTKTPRISSQTDPTGIPARAPCARRGDRGSRRETNENEEERCIVKEDTETGRRTAVNAAALALTAFLIAATGTVQAPTFTMGKECRAQVDAANQTNDAGQYAEALAAFDAIVKKCDTKDGKEAVQVGRAHSLNHLGRHSEAVEAANAVLAITKDTSLFAYFERVRRAADGRHGRRHRGLQSHHRAHREEPERVRARHHLRQGGRPQRHGEQDRRG
jgi:hypothetical protein